MAIPAGRDPERGPIKARPDIGLVMRLPVITSWGFGVFRRPNTPRERDRSLAQLDLIFHKNLAIYIVVGVDFIAVLLLFLASKHYI